ncbi:PDZ domain-containing protein [Dokdonella sp.]|uniref:PDZ domain-containing protein n=1 Tax=Dokdonella sp. TaxID=2291710 RepID=UPI003C5AD44F
MNKTLNRWTLTISLGLLLSACGSAPTRVEQPLELPEAVVEPIAETHYEPLIQRDRSYIEALRAEPAPERPEIVEGKSDRGDQRALAAEGFVRIGNGRYDSTDGDAEQSAIELGREVGADRIVIYREYRADESADASVEFLAAYYVRFKLLFGATFRNLTASERASLGVDGGVQIGAVVGGTPASQANLLAGDFVLGFNSRPVADRVRFQEMLSEQAGKAVTLQVNRNGQTMDRMVRLGAMPAGANQP